MIKRQVPSRIGRSWRWLTALIAALLLPTNQVNAAQIGIGAGLLAECFDLDLMGGDSVEAKSESSSLDDYDACLSGSRRHLHLTLELSSGWDVQSGKKSSNHGGFSINLPRVRNMSELGFVIGLVAVILIIGGIVYLVSHFLSSRFDIGLIGSSDLLTPDKLPPDLQVTELAAQRVGLTTRIFPFNYENFYISGSVMFVEEKLTQPGANGIPLITKREGITRRLAIGVQIPGDTGIFIEGQGELSRTTDIPTIADLVKEGASQTTTLPDKRSGAAIVVGLGLGF